MWVTTTYIIYFVSAPSNPIYILLNIQLHNSAAGKRHFFESVHADARTKLTKLNLCPLKLIEIYIQRAQLWQNKKSARTTQQFIQKSVFLENTVLSVDYY